jgi:predicted flap endonuclease-1-like 5' DNA nuclease
VSLQRRSTTTQEDQMTSIVDIEGVGDAYAVKLKAAGLTTVEALLEKGATPAGRKEIEAKSGISGKLILKWVNHADLFRISGVAGQYAELLEATGVDTVAELAQRKPENLHPAMVKANEEKKLVKVVAPLAKVVDWVDRRKNCRVK